MIRCRNCNEPVGITVGLPVAVSFADGWSDRVVATLSVDVIEVDDDFTFGACCEQRPTDGAGVIGPVLTPEDHAEVLRYLAAIVEVGRHADPAMLVSIPHEKG